MEVGPIPIKFQSFKKQRVLSLITHRDFSYHCCSLRAIHCAPPRVPVYRDYSGSEGWCWPHSLCWQQQQLTPWDWQLRRAQAENCDSEGWAEAPTCRFLRLFFIRLRLGVRARRTGLGYGQDERNKKLISYSSSQRDQGPQWGITWRKWLPSAQALSLHQASVWKCAK